MVLAQPAFDEKGQFVGHTKCTKVSLQEQLCRLWKEFVQEGKITQVRE